MKHLVLSALALLILPALAFGQNNASEYNNQSGISGAQNSAFGDKAGASNKSKNNVFVGYASGAENIGGNNTFVGSESGGTNAKGSGNIFIGYQSGKSSKDTSNSLYIENSSSNKPLIWGSFNKDIVNVNGKLGIGNANPQEALHVSGNVRGSLAKGALRIKTEAGYLDLGPQNSSYAHIYTDRPRIIFNKDAYTTTGGFSSYSTTDLNLKTNGVNRLIIKNDNGNVGIGTTVPDEKLTVKGKIHAEEIIVDLTVPGPDYVFEKYFDGASILKPSYSFPTLKEVEAFVKANKHLPEIPSANKMLENGVQLKEMNMKLLQKIEELTIYTIQQQKELEAQKLINESLEYRFEKLESLIKNSKND